MQERTSLVDALEGIGKVERELDDNVEMTARGAELGGASVCHRARLALVGRAAGGAAGHPAGPRDRRLRPVRVHSLRFIGPAALWARRRWRLDVPVVAHHHHLDADPLNRLIEKRVVEACDHVIVGSEFARRQLADALGARIDHVTVAPYGVDPRFAPRPPRADLRQRYGLGDGPVVLFFGGLKARKNLPLLLDVWATVTRVVPAARLLIAGGGPLLRPLRERAAAAGLADRVTFTGYVAEAEKADHFNLGEVFVFPSALEGFGLAVGEAMSSGLPVVASDRGSIPELLVDGEGGFLRDPARPAGFVEALVRLLREAPLRAKQGAANAERVDRWFRWERCVATTRRQYEAVLDRWKREAATRRAGPA